MSHSLAKHINRWSPRYTMAAFSISTATSPEDFEDTITLLEAYVKSLGIDLTFQDFAREKANMPGKYAAPTGTLLLARNANGEAIGCVGLRPLGPDGSCEMKRLYVDPRGRGLGAGKALAERVIDEAKRIGYKIMRLDTLQEMTSARALYKALGFVECYRYYETPIPGTIFMELRME